MKYIREFPELLLWLLLWLFISPQIAQSQTLKKYSFIESKLGTEFRLVFYAHDSIQADSIQRLVYDKIDELNMIFSDYEYDSEASRLSRLSSADTLITVSKEIHTLLLHAKKYYDLSGRALDVTIGPLTKLWRRAIRQRVFPDPLEVKTAKEKVGFHHVKILPKEKIHIKKKGLGFDFGAVAKGFIVDEVFRLVQSFGIYSVLVDGGGDIRAGEAPPNKPGWKIQIQDGRKLLLKLSL